MEGFIYEFLGTTILIFLGTGVVANVSLNKTYGHGAGLIVIAFAWAIGVFTGVFVAAGQSGAHLNPAVTIAFAFLGKFSWTKVPAYLAGQMLGAMAGALLTWLSYKKQYDATTDAAAIRGTFCNTPTIPSMFWNFITEMLATFVLIIGVLYIAAPTASLGALDALPVALVVLGIGLSLGGPTGYAINPARDLGPRIMHALLPIKNKGVNGWSYAWIPVFGPIAGAVLAASVYHFLHLP